MKARRPDNFEVMPPITRSDTALKYFWYWRPEKQFPPPAILRPREFEGPDRINIACTQTGLPAREERAIVDAWCDALPALNGVRFLWFSSRVPQRLFESACRVVDLEGLYIKWSGIESLSAIEGLRTLQYFHLGPSGRLASIDPLANCSQLRWLGLELLSRIKNLTPMATLTSLEGLSLEGSMGTTWRVSSLAPVGQIPGLRYLSIANLRSADGSLADLFSLSGLVTFRHGTWWNQKEIAEIHRRNPGLAPA